MRNTYLTVAISYVNAAPHLGYAYELVLADIAARARRPSPGGDVRLLGGTDDHLLKNVLAAEGAGRSTAAFVAAHAGRFAELGPVLGVGFDDFIHTGADERHRLAVERLWAAISDQGDLYRQSYRGSYWSAASGSSPPTSSCRGAAPNTGPCPSSSRRATGSSACRPIRT